MQSIAAERALRLSQLQSNGGDALDVFNRALNSVNDLSSNLKPYIDFAISITYQHDGLDSITYLSHPLRVATMAMFEAKDLSTPLVATALLHNIKEVSRPSFELLKDFADPLVVDAIDILTVERSNHKRSYTYDYYNAIYNSHSFVGIVKALDKLDNMFMLCLNKDAAVRLKYLQDISEFVLPIVSSHLPHLHRYFELLIQDCYSLGFVDLRDW